MSSSHLLRLAAVALLCAPSWGCVTMVDDVDVDLARSELWLDEGDGDDDADPSPGCDSRPSEKSERAHQGVELESLGSPEPDPDPWHPGGSSDE